MSCTYKHVDIGENHAYVRCIFINHIVPSREHHVEVDENKMDEFKLELHDDTIQELEDAVYSTDNDMLHVKLIAVYLRL